MDPETGCYSYDTLFVYLISYDDFDIDGTLFICENGSTTITVRDEFVSYLWSTGDTTSAITISEEGTYSVTVTLDNGCKGTRTIEVTGIAGFDLVINAPNTMCSDNPVTLSVDGTFEKYY